VLVLPIFITPNISHANAITDAVAGAASVVKALFTAPEASAGSESDANSISSSSSYEPTAPAINTNPVPVTPAPVSIDDNSLIAATNPSSLALEVVDSSNGQASTYIVHKGDTISAVAKMFDVSVNTVIWANNLTKNSSLKEGQALVILPISGTIHTVVAGDTLTKIAKKYGGDLNEISQFNDLAINDSLNLGDQIIIPDGEASSPTTVTSSSGVKTKVVYNVPNYSGYYVKPFVGGHQTQGLHGYRNSAVDYGMSVGTPLWAAAGGTVIRSMNSGWNGGYGNYVIIQHANNTQTIYGHMKNTIVSVGQTVTQGQLIGYSGNSGNSTGPHLHLEVRGAKNPFNFI